MLQCVLSLASRCSFIVSELSIRCAMVCLHFGALVGLSSGVSHLMCFTIGIAGHFTACAVLLWLSFQFRCCAIVNERMKLIMVTDSSLILLECFALCLLLYRCLHRSVWLMEFDSGIVGYGC